MEVLGSFTCRKAGTWDRFFHFPSEERHAEDFSDARKIQRLRPGLNPRTRVPEASMLTTRPPKPSYATVCDGEMALIQIIVPAYTTYEDGTDTVFWNAGL